MAPYLVCCRAQVTACARRRPVGGAGHLQWSATVVHNRTLGMRKGVVRAEALPPASCTALPAPLRRGSLLKESPASLPRWLLASLPARPFAEAERGATAEWVLPRPSGSGVSQGLAVSSGSKARWPSLPYTETQPP